MWLGQSCAISTFMPLKARSILSVQESQSLWSESNLHQTPWNYHQLSMDPVTLLASSALSSTMWLVGRLGKEYWENIDLNHMIDSIWSIETILLYFLKSTLGLILRVSLTKWHKSVKLRCNWNLLVFIIGHYLEKYICKREEFCQLHS